VIFTKVKAGINGMCWLLWEPFVYSAV